MGISTCTLGNPVARQHVAGSTVTAGEAGHILSLDDMRLAHTQVT